MIKVSEADLVRYARRMVEADAFVLSLWVLFEGWTVLRTMQLVRLASAAAVNPRPAAD